MAIEDWTVTILITNNRVVWVFFIPEVLSKSDKKHQISDHSYSLHALYSFGLPVRLQSTKMQILNVFFGFLTITYAYGKFTDFKWMLRELKSFTL